MNAATNRPRGFFTAEIAEDAGKKNGTRIRADAADLRGSPVVVTRSVSEGHRWLMQSLAYASGYDVAMPRIGEKVGQIRIRRRPENHKATKGTKASQADRLGPARRTFVSFVPLWFQQRLAGASFLVQANHQLLTAEVAENAEKNGTRINADQADHRGSPVVATRSVSEGHRWLTQSLAHASGYDVAMPRIGKKVGRIRIRRRPANHKATKGTKASHADRLGPARHTFVSFVPLWFLRSLVGASLLSNGTRVSNGTRDGAIALRCIAPYANA